MAFMDDVIDSEGPQPPRIMIYGRAGIGKSTFAASAPKPFFLPADGGLVSIRVNRFRTIPKTFSDVMAMANRVLTEEHDFRMLVVDGVDWVERMIFADICALARCPSIEDVGGGWGKGPSRAIPYWRDFIDVLEQIRERRGMGIILISHDQIKRFDDPENAGYDRYVPRLHEKAQSLFTEWCDCVFFATRRITVNGDTHKAAPIGRNGGERVIRTVDVPACLGKNRYDLPEEMNLSWPEVEAAIRASFNNENNENNEKGE